MNRKIEERRISISWTPVLTFPTPVSSSSFSEASRIRMGRTQQSRITQATVFFRIPPPSSIRNFGPVKGNGVPRMSRVSVTIVHSVRWIVRGHGSAIREMMGTTKTRGRSLAHKVGLDTRPGQTDRFRPERRGMKITHSKRV